MKAIKIAAGIFSALVLVCLSTLFLTSISCNKKNVPQSVSIEGLWSQQNSPDKVRPRREASNEQPDNGRPSSFAYRAVLDSARRYTFVENLAPANLAQLKSSGYVFFNFDGKELVDWQSGDGYLCLGFQYYSKPTSKEITQTRIKIPLPGSQYNTDRTQVKRDYIIKMMRKDSSYYPGVTEEDISNGAYPISDYDHLSRYAADEKELKQLLWARELCLELTVAATIYTDSFGCFAPDSTTLLNSLPNQIEAAWVSPLTGKAVTLVNQYDGVNPSYEVTPDGQTFIVTVPLQGAGTKEVSDIIKNKFLQAFHPGDCFQIQRSFDPALSEGFAF